MKRRTFAFQLMAAPLVAVCTTSCLGTSEEVDTLRGVDDLVGRVELLHFESELSKARAENALDSLEGVVSGGFRGDPVLAFEELVASIDLSEDQADELRDAVQPLHEAAESVFAQWAQDAEVLRIDSLRTRSLARLEDTRMRYHAILLTVEQAVSAYDAFNVGVRDHATYLEHDFNPSSVADLQAEFQTLTKWADELDLRLDACMDAAERYVEASALPGTVEVAQP